MAIITRTKNWIDRECLTHTDLNAEFSNITDNIIASDLTNKGMIERATDAEVVNGTDEERAVTPAGMLARTGTTARIGLVQLEDSHTSVLTTKAACPKNVKEAYDLAGTMLTKATFDANTFVYAVNDNTPVVKTRAEVMALLSGQAGADFALNTHKITGLVDPTADQEAATKKYVDDNTGSGDKIIEGDTSIEVIDTGTDGHVITKIDNAEIVRTCSSLASDITAIGATNVILEIINTQILGANQTIPANVTLRFLRGGKITLEAYDLIINGMLEASKSQQIFNENSTGVVKFNQSSGPIYVDTFYVAWWGAVAYDTRANAVSGGDKAPYIQDAVNAAEVSSVYDGNGITVRLLNGVYFVNSTITIDDHSVYLVGAGPWQTQLYRTSNNYGSTIHIDGTVYYTEVSNLALIYEQDSVDCTNAHLDIQGAVRSTFENLIIDSGYYGLRIRGGGHSSFTNIKQYTKNTGAGIAGGHSYFSFEYDATVAPAYPIACFITDCFSSSGSAFTQYGLHINACDGLWFENFHLGESGVGIRIYGEGTNKILSMYFSNTYVDDNDSNSHAVQINGTNTGAGVFHNIQFSNSYFRLSNSATMVSVGGNPTGISFTGCHFYNSDRQAISVGASTQNVSITGCVFTGNNVDNTANVTDIYINSGAKYTTIVGNTFGTTNTYMTGNSKGGVWVATSAATTGLVVVGNSFGDLPTDIINWAGLTGARNYYDESWSGGSGSGNVVGPAAHSANYVPQWNATPNSKTLVEGFAITTAGKAILDDANAAAQCTTLGLGTANAVTFATVNTGQGANELYDMNQDMLTTSSPTFVSPSITGYYKAQGTTPGFWLDETDGGVKGAYAVLDGGIFQVQRRATNFGAYEAVLFQSTLSNGNFYALGNITAGGSCCPDYVFEDSYELTTLSELSTYIEQNESLPGITFSCGDELNLNLAIEELMVKTEEQALYILQLHERLKTLELEKA